MESKIKDITEKYSKLEMNEETFQAAKSAIQLKDIIPPLKDCPSHGDPVYEFTEKLEYIMECIERNQKLYSILISLNESLLCDSLERVTNLKDYCSFFSEVIRRNMLWKYANTEYGLWPSNAFYCIWKTICFALFENPTLCSNLFHDEEFYPAMIKDYFNVIRTKSTIMKTAVIVLADSDLDAVINLLISITHEPCIWKITNVYIQESIHGKFLQLYKERWTKNSINFESMLTIFRFKEELPSTLGENHTDAISIWTENVTAAKSFVMNIMIPLTWINSYGELGPGITLPTDLKCSYLTPAGYPVKSDYYTGEQKKFDLFYDGSWKEPISRKYWIDDDGNSWAAANFQDMNSCVQSAKRGFEKWRSTPPSQRKRILRKFADRMQANGNEVLSVIIKSQLENPTLYGSSSTIIRDGTVEILTIRDPRGVVPIGSKDSKDLFRRLANACIAGNSIIVIHGEELSSIVEYCDMMNTSGIPPGVINFLSFENSYCGFRQVFLNEYPISYGSSPLFEFDDAVVEFLQSRTDLKPDENHPQFHEMLYTKFTQPKSIWLPLK